MASARSRAGNHSETDFDAAGQTPASPNPSIKRKRPSERTPCAAAVNMLLTDQNATNNAMPMRVPSPSTMRPAMR